MQERFDAFISFGKKENLRPDRIQDSLFHGGFGMVAAGNVKKHGVVYFTLTKRTFTPDRGYDYDKVISFH